MVKVPDVAALSAITEGLAASRSYFPLDLKYRGRSPCHDDYFRSLLRIAAIRWVIVPWTADLSVPECTADGHCMAGTWSSGSGSFSTVNPDAETA